MKSLLRPLAVGLLGIIVSHMAVSDTQAQTRDLGANRLILDDGMVVPGILTISYAGPGNSNFIIPPGGATTVQPGTMSDQTLRWDGAVWIPSNALMNDGTNISIPIGDLTVSGIMNGNGSGITNIDASNIATGTLDLARISTTGAMTDQALMYNGANLVYAFPSASSLVLPFSQTASSGSTLFSLTNSGAGGVANFINTLATSPATAVEIEHNGMGYGLDVSLLNMMSGADAITGYTVGTGQGVRGESQTGIGIYGVTTNGTGIRSHLSGLANTNPSLYSTTFGLGPAGSFSIFNGSNNAAAVQAQTNALGNAGLFEITNVASSATVLLAETSGIGTAVEGTSTAGHGGWFYQYRGW